MQRAEECSMISIIGAKGARFRSGLKSLIIQRVLPAEATISFENGMAEMRARRTERECSSRSFERGKSST